MLWSLPWETPSGGSLHSGAQTGVAPGVTVDHACLHQSRFDSERSHVMTNRKQTYVPDYGAVAQWQSTWLLTL